MPPRLLPDATGLRVLLETMTHQEIADRYGVSRSSVTRTAARDGAERSKMRHTELLPWRVQVRHATDYAARMLRLEGRLRAGELVSEKDQGRLESWKAKMAEGDLVILYVPEHDCEHCGGNGGFHPMVRSAAKAKYGKPDARFDTELIFVTKRQGGEIRDLAGDAPVLEGNRSPVPRPRGGSTRHVA